MREKKETACVRKLFCDAHRQSDNLYLEKQCLNIKQINNKVLVIFFFGLLSGLVTLKYLKKRNKEITKKMSIKINCMYIFFVIY